MAANWFGLKRTTDGKIVSYISDNAAGYSVTPPAGYTYQGPYASQTAAQQALEPAPAPIVNATIAAILAKPLGTRTIDDVISFLQQKLGT